MNCKSFPTRAVAGVATGVALEDNAIIGISNVMDLFYPGIMTIGTAAMQPHARDEIYRQHPDLKDFVETHGIPVGLTPEACEEWASKCEQSLGLVLQLEGPLEVSHNVAKKHFDDFLGRNQ